MKLSELTTNETLDVLCEITPCVERIVKDEEILHSIGSAMNTNGMTTVGVLMAGADRISAVIPALLKTHREDVYSILAAVNRVDTQQIGEQRLTDTLTQIYDIFHDEELLAFFKSFRRQGQTTPSTPSVRLHGSGQEDTLQSSQAS